MMKTQSWKAIKLLIIMTVLTGITYPAFITAISWMFFNNQANGSLIISDGTIIGSELIGQKLDSAAFFWSRPSAIDYNPLPSGGSNLGPTSDKLKNLVEDRKTSFIHDNLLDPDESVPPEMVFASASGLDPHISPAAALMEVERICLARNFSAAEKEKLLEIINKQTEKPQYLIFGEERINVLLLNLELQKIQ
jgi:potassium-transporting ATPase KdpC subunit